MAIFNSYVKLPEGTTYHPHIFLNNPKLRQRVGRIAASHFLRPPATPRTIEGITLAGG